MVRMISTAEHQYYGRRLHVGVEYDCDEKDVDLMRKMGWARPKQAEAQHYETRVLTAGQSAAGTRATGRRNK